MANDSKTWRCGKYELSFDRPRIMGVLNVTPDSFSDGGEHFDPDAAIEYGLAMLDAGADIIDVGGESTRPGFTPVNPDEEARRVLPVVRALAKEGAIVSIDTRHVARVDRDDGALFGQRAHHGQHAASLLVGINRGKAGARGLTAHVDDVGAGVKHRQAVLDGGIRVEVLPAVAKRIGRHVEDAHDARTVKAELILSAPPCLAVVRHEHPPKMPTPPSLGSWRRGRFALSLSIVSAHTG